MIELIGYALAAVAGLSLGLIGSGGSILTVPILVYLLGVDPVAATGYSLFVVGATSLVGGLQNAFKKNVDFRTVVVFGIPSIAAVYFTRAWLLPALPEDLLNLGNFELTKGIALMILFAVIMMLASLSMIKGRKEEDSGDGQIRYNYPMILIEGILVGVLTGLVGAGGGFLIIPALVLLAKMPMKKAVGTSLFIIAAKSLLGFTGELQSTEFVDWKLVLIFTGVSIAGIFLGVLLAQKIDGKKLKKGFGWFVLVMGIIILTKELFF